MIAKILELSTGHITLDDNNMLKISMGLTCAQYEYGYFIHVPELESDEKFMSRYSSDYSESFIKVLEYAKANDCRFICLDGDADLLDTDKLNVHEW